MDFFTNETYSIENYQMSERDRQEFAEALSTRYMQLTVLSDVTNILIDDPEYQKAEEELHLLRTIILDLPEDILNLVRLRVSL